MTFKVSDNQYGRPHPSDSWAFCDTIAECDGPTDKHKDASTIAKTREALHTVARKNCRAVTTRNHSQRTCRRSVFHMYISFVARCQ